MENHFYSRKSGTVWGKPYRLVYFLWRHMPESLKSALFTKSTLGTNMKISGRNFLASFAGREDLYSAAYYSYVDAEASRGAPTIVASVLSEFAPQRLIDVGCGTGSVLAAFNSKGVSGVGLEYSAVALKACQERGLNVYSYDIESEERHDFGEFDIAICFEVAEHLSATCADRLDLALRMRIS